MSIQGEAATGDIYSRVKARMDAAGETGNPLEAANYLIEEAMIMGQQAGFSYLDMGFWRWAQGEGDKQFREEFQKIFLFIDDEKFQNSLIPVGAEMVINGASIDQLPNGVGVFGLEDENPIPVNGTIGEVAYLSRLENNQGERFLFHRIGAIDMIDVFEATTYSGSAWFIFFMDMYHPRRSRKAPPGFQIAPELRQFSGFHNYCPNFPYGFSEAKEATGGMMHQALIPTGNIKPQLQQRVFARPLAHKAKLDIVMERINMKIIGFKYGN